MKCTGGILGDSGKERAMGEGEEGGAGQNEGVCLLQSFGVSGRKGKLSSANVDLLEISVGLSSLKD